MLRDATERVSATSKRAAKAATATALGASRRAVAAAPTVVVKAATILEEEVALGLRAVQRIEQRFLDVDALRAQDSDAVMSKFRRDAHDAVDIILDVLTAAAQRVGAQAGRLVNVTAGATHLRKGATPDGIQVPALRVPGRVTPGSTGEIAMSLENPGDVGTTTFTLQASDLVGGSGTRIPSASVTFNPPTLSVGAREAGKVSVRVRVPDGTPAGTYEGLVRATELEGLRAMLAVVVG